MAEIRTIHNMQSTRYAGVEGMVKQEATGHAGGVRWSSL